jgi:dTDP-4-dehydrorhamnose reductase
MPFVATDIEVDFTDMQSVNSYAFKIKPAVIVNCAASTAVDQAEDNKPAATRLNRSVKSL